MNDLKQSGRTTQQMKNAKRNSVFVWPNNYLQYPKALAQHLGRNDLIIVGMEWITKGKWYGGRFADIILDHSIELTHDNAWHYRGARARITNHE